MHIDTEDSGNKMEGNGELQRKNMLKLANALFIHQSKLFLRHNLLLPELEEVLRWGGVRVALNDPEFAIDGREEAYQQTHSHAAVITGLSRQEVARSIQLERPPVDPAGSELHRIIRVLTAWRTEPGYQDEAGHPIDLALRGAAPSLHQLCIKHGRDTTTRAIADILVREGNADWIGESEGNKTGKMLRYVHPVVTADTDTEKNVAIFTQIGSDFLHSLQKMIGPNDSFRPRFRQGYYNDISAEKADEAMEELHVEIQRFNVHCTEIMKKYRAKNGEPVVRLGVGSYSFRNAPLLLRDFPPDIEPRAVPSKSHTGGVK